MRYPTILQYIESLNAPGDFLKRLSGISAVAASDDPHCSDIEYACGSYGVVFPVEIPGERREKRALKCFIRSQPGRSYAYQQIIDTLRRCGDSPYLASTEWLSDEIFVFDDHGQCGTFPVVAMDWIQGKTLTGHLDTLLAQKEKDPADALRILSRDFDKLASWLLSQPFAHGDLKPDNIMVRESDGQMVLIDYDGMYVPSMSGEQSRETGTVGFTFPDRSEHDFGKHIDNYSIAIISVSLRILALYPELYRRFDNSFVLLFNPPDVVSGTDEFYNRLAGTEFGKDPLFRYLSDPKKMDCEQILRWVQNTCQDSSREPVPTVTTRGYSYRGEPVEGIVLCRRNGKYGYIREGTEESLTGFIFDKACDFSEGFAAVCTQGRWGFIDRQGELAVPMEFTECGSFSEGLAPVRLGAKWGFVDLLMRLTIPPRFESVSGFRQGLALFRRRGKYGFIDSSGRSAIPARYDFAQDFHESVACVKVGGLYGYIDQRGNYLIRPMFDYARSKHDGKVYVEIDGKGRTIDMV